ncbi:MAG TPA: hypothetical protein VFW44_13955 [Bryobacteraceae bacterium]|nr:hypothetical protein [Bryobacteraceae bacterium]
MNRRNVLLFLLCFGAISCSAQTVISVTGTSAGTDNEEAVGQVSWTQTGTFTGVTIQATIESCMGSATGTAYLTRNGTAVGNQIAVNNALSVNGGASGADTTVTVFSGLTLTPGTYFLTIAPNGGNECEELWQNISSSPVVSTGSGVSAGSSGGTGAGHPVAPYPPQSSFSNPDSYLFSVTSNAAPPPPTPIPSTAILGGMGLVFLFWYSWRYRRSSNTV